jgi:hypothetical protein
MADMEQPSSYYYTMHGFLPYARGAAAIWSCADMAAHVLRQLVAPGATVFSVHDADVEAEGPWTTAPVISLPFLFANLALPGALCDSEPGRDCVGDSCPPKVMGPFGARRPGNMVLLFGHMSLRRQAVVDDLRQRGLHVHVTNSTFDDDLFELLDRTAVVVAPALYPGAKWWSQGGGGDGSHPRQCTSAHVLTSTQ